jgi:hypothetical protein
MRFPIYALKCVCIDALNVELEEQVSMIWR